MNARQWRDYSVARLCAHHGNAEEALSDVVHLMRLVARIGPSHRLGPVRDLALAGFDRAMVESAILPL